MAKKKSESFEELLGRTEEIVEELEGGEMSLDESLKKYEEGVANLRKCAALIASAEEKVKVLIEEAEGAFSLEDLDAEGEEE